MREVMARLGHSTTSAAIRYQKAAADRDRALAERLDELVDGLRTSANADDSGPDPADRPAGAAGFSRGAGLTRQHQRRPETEESPAGARDSLEHPQRDSNPCRHLESSTRPVRPVRPGAARPVVSALSVRVVRRDRPRDGHWITNRITSIPSWLSSVHRCRHSRRVCLLWPPRSMGPSTPCAQVAGERLRPRRRCAGCRDRAQ